MGQPERIYVLPELSTSLSRKDSLAECAGADLNHVHWHVLLTASRAVSLVVHFYWRSSLLNVATTRDSRTLLWCIAGTHNELLMRNEWPNPGFVVWPRLSCPWFSFFTTGPGLSITDTFANQLVPGVIRDNVTLWNLLNISVDQAINTLANLLALTQVESPALQFWQPAIESSQPQKSTTPSLAQPFDYTNPTGTTQLPSLECCDVRMPP